MIFKKVFSSALAASLLFTGAAFADGISVKYNNAGKLMEIEGSVGTRANALVSVAVYEDAEVIDFSKPVIFSSVYTGADGRVDFDLKTTESFESGKYAIYLSTSESSADGVLNYVSIEGITYAMNAISGKTESEAVADVIMASRKNLGIDEDVADSVIEKTAAILVSRKDVDYTNPDKFFASFTACLAHAYLNEVSDTLDVLKKYESELGVNLKELEALDSRTFKALLGGIKNADYTKGLLPSQLPELTFIAGVKKSESWSELKYEILGLDENGNKTNNNFKILNPDTEYYSKVKSINNVYKAMYGSIGDVQTIEDLRKLFEGCAEDAYYDEKDSSNGGGGGGSSSGGGKLALTPYVPVEIVTPPEPDAKFSDIASHWAKQDIEALAEAGIISGYPDGTFMPDKPVTRAEFVKLISLSFELPLADGVSDFDDVANNAWYKDYVDAAVGSGLIKGVSERSFNPDGLLSREDASLILFRYISLSSELKASVNKFTDDSLIADYAKDAVYALSGSGIVNGMENGSFEPKSELTRAQACKLLNVAMAYGK